MFVCVCNAITDSEVREAAESGVSSVADLGRALGVATNCGTCADLAQSILDTHKASAATPPYREVPADMSGVHRYISAPAQ